MIHRFPFEISYSKKNGHNTCTISSVTHQHHLNDHFKLRYLFIHIYTVHVYVRPVSLPSLIARRKIHNIMNPFYDEDPVQGLSAPLPSPSPSSSLWDRPYIIIAIHALVPLLSLITLIATQKIHNHTLFLLFYSLRNPERVFVTLATIIIIIMIIIIYTYIPQG